VKPVTLLKSYQIGKTGDRRRCQSVSLVRLPQKNEPIRVIGSLLYEQRREENSRPFLENTAELDSIIFSQN
jgi:hypothetical protein